MVEVVEVVYAAVAAGLFAAGWCSKRHSCREHARRREVEREPVPVVVTRVRPELPVRGANG